MQMQCKCITDILQRKRNKERKESFPHTPFKEKEINKEKEALLFTRARARRFLGFSVKIEAKWKE